MTESPTLANGVMRGAGWITLTKPVPVPCIMTLSPETPHAERVPVYKATDDDGLFIVWLGVDNPNGRPLTVEVERAHPSGSPVRVENTRGRQFELPEPEPAPKRIVQAAEVDAAIREVLDEFCSDSCAEAGKRALLAALEDHKPRETGDPDDPDYTCSSCFYFTSDWPCSTVWRIADALGIEVSDD